jgi:hypothetical protein
MELREEVEEATDSDKLVNIKEQVGWNFSTRQSDLPWLSLFKKRKNRFYFIYQVRTLDTRPCTWCTFHKIYQIGCWRKVFVSVQNKKKMLECENALKEVFQSGDIMHAVPLVQRMTYYHKIIEEITRKQWRDMAFLRMQPICGLMSFYTAEVRSFLASGG